MNRRASRRTPMPLVVPALRASAVVAVSLLVSVSARANDLAADARRAESVWSSTSNRVLHLAPVFLVSGEARPIPLSRAALASPDSECTTIGVLGASTMDFSLELRGSDAAAAKRVVRESEGTRSVAGALTLVRCGGARQDLDGLVLRMKSPQGALEVLIARGAKPAPLLDALFPERAAGPSVPEVEREPPPITAPRSARVLDAERSILQSGGRVTSKLDEQSGPDGRGSVRLRLNEGCHRLVVVAESWGTRGPVPVDVDCELLVGRSPEPLKRDRSFAADGVIQACLPVASDVLLRWGGAPGGAPTTIVQGSWDVPEAIPAEWPARARAGLAEAVLRRHVPLGEEGPVWEGSGGTSRTTLPVPVTPGVCYVLGIGALAGEVRAVRLVVQQGARISSDSGQVDSDGAAVSFCAEAPGMAKVDVNAIGSQVTWLAGLWPVGTVQVGSGEAQ